MSATVTYTVVGMTCSHCVSSVSEEVSAVPGVANVEVELETGTLRVTSDRPVEVADISAAVDEAGYQLVTS